MCQLYLSKAGGGKQLVRMVFCTSQQKQKQKKTGLFQLTLRYAEQFSSYSHMNGY